jgi:hypothetical protein
LVLTGAAEAGWTRRLHTHSMKKVKQVGFYCVTMFVRGGGMVGYKGSCPPLVCEQVATGGDHESL